MPIRNLALACAAALAVAVPAPALAAPSTTPVWIENLVDFDSETPDGFDSNLAGCESGEVVEGRVRTNFTDWGGVFSGEKVFLCADGSSGFVVQLNARFGDGGSTGTWRVTDSWGSQEGLVAHGSLIGIPQVDALLDVYTGTRVG